MNQANGKAAAAGGTAGAGGAAGSGAAKARAPLQWGLVAVGVPTMALAVGGAALLGKPQDALGPGLIALFTVMAALASPREKLWRAALVIGGATFFVLILANVTIQTPVLAGVAMFAVAFLGTMIGAAGQALSVAGTLVSMAYMLPAATGIARSTSLEEAAELGLIGLGAAAISIGAIVAIRAVRGTPEDESLDAEREPEPQAQAPTIREQVRAAFTIKDATFRYALRRSLALGIAMGVYAYTESHNVFWVMLTIFIVLQPDRASIWHKALSRSAGVLVGTIVVAGLGEFLPANVIIGIGMVVMFVGFAWYLRNYAIYSAGISFTVIAVLGASDGNFSGWALTRIADTAIGATIALLIGYLVLPEPWWRRNEKEPVSPPGAP